MKMNTRLLSAAAVTVALLSTNLPQTAQAHHGVNGQFDLSQTIVIEGEVTRVRFVNPHSYVYFDVTGDDGNVVNWRCELRSGSLLRRKGWSTDLFADGTKIRIFGSPARTEPTTCYTETVTFSDGDTLYRYGEVDDNGDFVNTESAMGAAANIEEAAAEDTSMPATANLSGDWGEPVADGPPLAYAGPGPAFDRTQAAIDAGGNWTSKDNPRFKCQPTNIILDYRFDQMVNRIEQTDEIVNIKYGFMDLERNIHIGGDFPANIEPSLAGYSVGVWKDDKLVVTTKGFATGFLEVIGGRSEHSVPHSDQMEVTEIFYVDDAGELVREYTITDPVNLATPYSHLDKSVRADGEYAPFNCDDLTVDSNR